MPGFSAPRLQKDEGSSVGAGQSQKVCSDLCTLCSRFWLCDLLAALLMWIREVYGTGDFSCLLISFWLILVSG